MTLRLALLIEGDASSATKAVEQTKRAIGETGTAAEVAGKRMAVGAETGARHFTDATRSARLTTLQMQNLQFQLQDITQGLLTGQSPFRLMLQQGSQVVQMFRSGTGVTAALRSVGTGIVAFVTNPLNVALLGFSAVAGAASLFFSVVRSGGESTEDVLDRHEELIGRIRDAWPEATEGVRDYARESIDVFERQLAASREALRGQLRALGREIEEELTAVTLLESGAFSPELQLIPDFEPFRAAIEPFLASVRAGEPDVRSFRQAIAEIAQTDPENAALQALAARLLDLTDDASKVDRALFGAEDAIRRLGAAASGELQAVKDFGDALNALSGIALPRLDDRARAAEAFDKALRNASGVEERQLAFEAYRQTLDRIAAEEQRLADEQAARATASRAGSARIVEGIDAEADALQGVIDRFDTLRGVAEGTLTGIANSIRRGASAGEILLGIVNRVADAFIRTGSTALSNIFFGASGTAGGGLLGSLFSAFFGGTTAEVGHGGGGIGSGTLPTRTVPARAFFGAPRLHGGGLIGGERAVIGLEGEEIGFPEDLSRKYGGPRVSNNFFIQTPNPRAFAESRASVARAAGRFVGRARRFM